ncbi:SGNH/GDSL hydrolase family protein [Candidatus Thiosymbion oneisti]|uniref:SGNH/GDSL hydrolase family protein n=1 Tax=Candidatus Thiosymbion oneisti TaxID=589554 RepID=UPI00114CCF65|nr:hypothetical protein [Candidatus Thiosymbion oneisti]
MFKIKKELIGSLLLLLISLSISLLMGELLIRWLAPQQLQRGYVIPDADLGHILGPNQVYYDELAPKYFTYHVRTNSNGLRMDDEVDLSVDKKRIIMLGDSFTFGWGVEIGKSFAQIIKENMEKQYHNIQLLNAGIGAYSTGHVLKYLRRFHKKLDIDGVIYFMNSNDLQDNMKTSIDYQVVSFDKTESGLITLKDKKVYSQVKRFVVTKVPLYVWLNKNSHLFVFIKRILKGSSRNADPVVKVSENTLSPENERMVHAVAMAHLDRLSEYCKENSLPLLVIWIPDQRELFAGNIPFYERFKGKVVKRASETNYSYYDPTKELKAMVSGEEVSDIYFPEGHYNEKGYYYYSLAVEESIRDFIDQYYGI